MVTPHTWHPGARWLDPKWAIPIELQPDELLSSWLVRAALANGCDPLVLTGNLWPRWRPWTTDIDRYISSRKLVQLSSLSGIPVLAFKQSTLASVLDDFIDTKHLPQGVWPWILSIGARNTRRRLGLQYCPLCLLEDSAAYFRIQWRLSWNTACPKHKTLLLAQCPRCGSFIEPHRLQAEDRKVSVCAKCKYELFKAKPLTTVEEALFFQNCIDAVVKGGSGKIWGIEYKTKAWLDSISYLISFVRRMGIIAPSHLARFFQKLDLEPCTDIPLMPSYRFESLDAYDRQTIAAHIWSILNLPYSIIEEAFHNERITKQMLCPKGIKVPFFLRHCWENAPDNTSCRRNNTGNIPKGRSIHAVRVMGKKLERQLKRRRYEEQKQRATNSIL